MNLLNHHEKKRRIFEFDESIRSFGWYHVERHWSGSPYRWSGPHIESIVVLEVPRSEPLSLDVIVVGAMDQKALNSVKVFGDGRLLESVVTGHEFGWKLSMVVPARESGSHRELELSFKVLATLKPSVVKNEPDDRLLGIAVMKFEFEPISAQ
ncbi:MAG: hypothetical protein IE937_10230 [Gammaproteobacteria bacterium]|nr:hypothetical protein [Gammaproteobacteria bacterium]